jgi:hypothetical protein
MVVFPILAAVGGDLESRIEGDEPFAPGWTGERNGGGGTWVLPVLVVPDNLAEA